MPRLSRKGEKSGLIRMAELTGIRKGMNGSKGWFYLGTGLWTVRTVRRMAERKTEVLVSERLKPGQRMEIVAMEPVTRKQRKAERKRARKG